MQAEKPTVYIIHGDHDLAIREFIDTLRKKLGDVHASQMDVQRFDGNSLEFGSFEEACTTIPFMSPRRLVILENSEAALGKGKRDLAFFELLDKLPQSTALVLVHPHPLQQTSDLLQWAQDRPSKVFVRSFHIPKGQDFSRWIIKRCRDLGGEVEPQAAELLAELVGGDANLAERELEKLLDYVDRQRSIDVSDVEQLTPFHGQSNVFAMVDAVGQRDGQQAFTHLRRLLADHPPRYAFSMIVRQFRLLLQVREALDNQIDPHKVLKVHAFVINKIIAQARNFSLSDLERIYHKLLDIDLASKTGRMDLDVALDSLLATLAV
ncbi:MAG: DNA polymerase III subunit delta [Anaerolineales bacterium]|jgi:DNA polymerase-3 subunit delta